MELDIEKAKRSLEWLQSLIKELEGKEREAQENLKAYSRWYTLRGQEESDRLAAVMADEQITLFAFINGTLHRIETSLSDALGIDPDAEAEQKTEATK